MAQLPSVSVILELEARQDDALRQLEELEAQVEKALAEFTAAARPAQCARATAEPMQQADGPCARLRIALSGADPSGRTC
jgi:hypothetical protein